jgi:hypothetical protein
VALVAAAPATAAAAARITRTGRAVGLAVTNGDDGQNPLNIGGLASRTSRFCVPENELFELTRTLSTDVLVKRHGISFVASA